MGVPLRVCVCAGARVGFTASCQRHTKIFAMSPSSVSGELYKLLHMGRAQWLVVRKTEEFAEENLGLGKGEGW